MPIKNIGYRLKNLREINNFSQEYLARTLNISQAAYSKIENGSTQLSLEHLIKISKLYKINYDYLLGTNDSHNINDIQKTNDGKSKYTIINILQ